MGREFREPDADNDASTDAVSEGQEEIAIPAHLHGLLNREPHDASSFYLACKKICNDPKRRRKYFPVANAVRRIRTWTGSNLPADVEKRVKYQLSRFPSTKRRPCPPKAVLVSLLKCTV